MLFMLADAREDKAEDASVEVYSPFGLFSPGTLGSASQRQHRHPQLSWDSLRCSEYQDYSLGLVKDLGVNWVRMDFLFDGSTFSNEQPEYLGRLHAEGVEVVGCVYPLNRNRA